MAIGREPACRAVLFDAAVGRACRSGGTFLFMVVAKVELGEGSGYRHPVVGGGSGLPGVGAQPSQLVSLSLAGVKDGILAAPLQYVLDRTQALVWSVSFPGYLCSRWGDYPGGRLIGLPVLALFAFFQVKSMITLGTYFAQDGNVIDHRGYVMYDYDTLPLLPQPVWALLGLAGAVCLALLFAACVERAWTWVRSKPRRERAGGSGLMIYSLGAVLALLTLVVSPFIFDRYCVPLVPFLAVVT